MRKDLNKKDPYGRLLKKERIPVDNEHFVLQEYRWLDFSTDRLVFTDNTRATVIQKDLHDPKELRDKVTVPKAFSTRFRAPVQPLFPIDLSADYRKFVIETRQRRKRRNFDDDDSTTIDFSEISTPPDLEGRMSKWKARSRTEVNQKEVPASNQSNETNSEQAAGAEPSRNTTVQLQTTDSSQNFKEAETAGQKETDATQMSASTGEGRRGMRPASDISQAARDRILASLNARTGVLDESKALQSDDSMIDSDAAFLDKLGALQDSIAEQAAVTHSQTGQDFSGEQRAAPEGVDLEPSHEAAPTQRDTKDRFDAKRQQESYEQGYQDATVKFKELHTVLDATKKELESLREKVMLEGRDIFMEVLKLSTENILRRQLSLNDAALKGLFESAVENLHQARKIAVSCSAETLASLRAQYQEASLPFDSVDWIVNDSLPSGDIKIVTKDEVIKIDLAQLVKKQIASFADDLFGEDNGSQEKPRNETKGEAS